MKAERTETDRKISFDVINILACIGVISLHHNGLVHSFDGGTRGWIQSLVVECLAYCSVPLFMMLSGAKLIPYQEKYNTGVFFRKRVIKTVIPWLFWSIIFLIWKASLGEITLEPETIHQALRLISTYQVESVYWFFGSLFACYLLIPILSCLRKQHKILWYLVGLNFFFVSSWPYLQKLLNISWSLNVIPSGTLIIFVILGYLLSTVQLSQKNRVCIYIVGLTCVLFRFLYTWHFSIISGRTDTSIKGYESFHSVIYTCAVFVAFTKIPWEKVLPEWLRRRLPAISNRSFGIFMIHRMVMRYESLLLGIGNHHWTWRILCIPLTYFVSLGIVSLIRKIPGLKYVAG